MAPAIIFGYDAVCHRCQGRGWLAHAPTGVRAAYPSELRDYAAGKAPQHRLAPCLTCGCTGVVHYRYA